MGSCLGTVEEHRHASLLGQSHDLANGIDGPESVRDMSHGHQAGAFAEQALVGLHVELTAIVDGDHLELGSGVGTYQLPRHDIRMMLHLGDEHLVSRLEPRPQEAPGHQVDAFRGTAHEDDLVFPRGAQESSGGFAGGFVAVGRSLGEGVHAAVDVRVGAAVARYQGVDHRLGLVRGRRAVEIDQGLAVDLLIESRKVGPDLLEIEGSGLLVCGEHTTHLTPPGGRRHPWADG